MKKMFLLVVAFIAMSFASNSLFAQNVNTSGENQNPTDLIVSDASESEDASDLSETPIADSTVSDGTPAAETVSSASGSISAEDLQALIAVLNNQTGNEKRNVLPAENNIFVPFKNKGKWNGHYVCQRLELSFLGEKGKSANDMASEALDITSQTDSKLTGDNSVGNYANQLGLDGAGLGLGANFGYSLVFIPGSKEGDELLLNRYGFGYSVGVIVQFDNEKDAGVTCDMLGKIGIETGFNKAIGVGVDFLFGGGKTTECTIDFYDVDWTDPQIEDVEVTSESQWCGKVGAQFWVRLNFLTKSVKNFDTALFSRFVYSFRPYGEEEFNRRVNVDMELPAWQYESWGFGFTATYFF